jgi:hypothetical protein
MTHVCILAFPIGSMKLTQLHLWRRTWVLNTSIKVPEGCRIKAVATPLPAYQSPLQTAIGRPFNPKGYMEVLNIGHRENTASPLPRNPAK